MKRAVACPWCSERVVMDDRHALGSPEARAHLRRCQFSPCPEVGDTAWIIRGEG